MSIKEKMEAKREKAIEEIKTEFWNDQPDDDRISEIALANGIDAGSVAKWQDEIESAKQQKVEVESVDLEQLKSASKKAASQAKAASTRASKAQDVFAEASRKSKVADRAVKDASDGFRQLTNTLYKIDTPLRQIPEHCKLIHELDLVSERRDNAKQAARKTRQNVDKILEQLEIVQEQIDGFDERTMHGEVSMHAGDLMPRAEAMEKQRDALEGRLKKAREADDEAEKTLESSEEVVQSARSAAGL